jgi:IucA/IucC family protein/ferric iron reductase FhuF-like transporter
VNCEQVLAAAIVNTLLRENYGGLAGRIKPGPVLALPDGRVLPLRPDGFLTDYRLGDHCALVLADVDALVAALADPRDSTGVAAFRSECREALAGMRLMQSRPVYGTPSYDALAARLPHPAYPTWASRAGWSEADALRYAPEFMPEFLLAWIAVPARIVVKSGAGAVPGWWPAMADVGLPPALARGHVLFPVHPLTVPDAWVPGAVLAPRRWLAVRPTLSTRTVAVTAGEHVKVPLAASTLGRRNRRAIGPDTLADGALVHRVLGRALAADPWLDAHLLLADDSSYAHAGHPYLGYLLRRLPAAAVPVAALLAPGVIEELAGPDLAGWFGAYLDVLFGVAVRLFVRFGIALESHQQNLAVVCPGPRLLVKDFDGALINYRRLAAALGAGAPAPSAFADQRLLTDSDDALADVFITITVHLCAGAIAFGLASRLPLERLLGVVRHSLCAALDAHGGAGPAAVLLRGRLLDADRLPGKTMVTAGTLVDKARTGARDVNKFYGTSGPNYLAVPA